MEFRGYTVQARRIEPSLCAHVDQANSESHVPVAMQRNVVGALAGPSGRHD